MSAGYGRRGLVAGLMGMGVALALAAPVAAAETPTFSKDVAPILQAKCQACHQPNSIAPMSLMTFQEARPWARSMKERVSSRQMPPWHIDKSVGIQSFKNDMSLSDEQIDTIVRWVDGGAPQGDPKDLPPAKPPVTSNEWQGVLNGYGPPDLVIKSSEHKMPAKHQDVWYRPQSDIPITEPRWIRMVEIRPSNLSARKTLHHSVAYQVLSPDNVQSINTGLAPGPSSVSADDAVNRRPMIMEWAIGKGYDRYRDDTGKLLMPGEKISWDQHIHAVGEEIPTGSELAFWFYPKGQEPKKRSYLVGFTGIDRTKMLDIPPNSIARTEGFTVLKENTMITNFQPHFHLRGKAMEVEAIMPDGNRQLICVRGQFQLQLDDQLHLHRRRGAGVPEGDRHPRERLLRQHDGEQEQPGSGAVGRLRRPHG